jgi:hypothetical protein
MSERPHEQPSTPDEFDVESGFYQGAALELLYVCLEKFSEAEVDEAESIDEEVIYLSPPSTYDDSVGQWERIDVYKYSDNWREKGGRERLARVEFNQFLTDEVEFIKRYTLSFKDGYMLHKQFYLFLGYEETNSLAWRAVSQKNLVMKDELNELTSLIDLASIDSDHDLDT